MVICRFRHLKNQVPTSKNETRQTRVSGLHKPEIVGFKSVGYPWPSTPGFGLTSTD